MCFFIVLSYSNTCWVFNNKYQAYALYGSPNCGFFLQVELQHFSVTVIINKLKTVSVAIKKGFHLCSLQDNI